MSEIVYCKATNLVIAIFLRNIWKLGYLILPKREYIFMTLPKSCWKSCICGPNICNFSNSILKCSFLMIMQDIVRGQEHRRDACNTCALCNEAVSWVQLLFSLAASWRLHGCYQIAGKNTLQIPRWTMTRKLKFLQWKEHQTETFTRFC